MPTAAVSGRTLGAVPVQDDDGGVVVEVAPAGFQDRCGQHAHGLPGMQVTGFAHEGSQIDSGGTALLHAVGEQDQAVSGVQLQLLELVRGGRGDPERQIDDERHLLGFGGTCPQAQRPGMSGVDQFTGAGVETDAQQLSGGQPATVGQQGLVGAMRLTERVAAGAAGSAQRTRDQRRQQGGLGVVAHRVGDGQVQRVPVEGVVVGVAADVVGRDETCGEGELGASQQEAEGSS